MKKCSFRGCPGEYEKKLVTHVVRRHGDVAVIEKVPAEVCSVCGDVLLPLKRVEAIEELLHEPGKPKRTAAVYEMPQPKSMAA